MPPTAAQGVLRLREYQTAEIGDRWDPDARIVTPRFIERLERLQHDSRREIFKISRRSITASNYVGTLGLDGLTVDVLPKIDADNASTRRNLTTMLTTAGMVPHLSAGLPGVEESEDTLVDAYMRLYCQRLHEEWRRGSIRGYRRTRDNRRYLKGKLDLPGHIRLNMQRRDRFMTRADEFVVDNELSRLLKAALRLCLRFARAASTQRLAAELLPEFEEVRDLLPNDPRWARVDVDRQTVRFAPIVTLAKILLQGATPDQPGARRTYSLVFDMNMVFERYIGTLMVRRVCPPALTADLQVTDAHLLQENGRPCFRLRPDIGVYESGELKVIIDTKWKRLDPAKSHSGIAQADMYQMYAYGKEYRCPVVILLYPRSGTFTPQVTRYSHNAIHEHERSIGIHTVDISASGDQKLNDSVSSQLRDIITRARAAR